MAHGRNAKKNCKRKDRKGKVRVFDQIFIKSL